VTSAPDEVPRGEFLDLTVADGIATLTLNDPPTKHSMSLAMMDAFARRGAEINRRDDIRVVIVTGAGDTFSAGGNINDMKARQGVFASEDSIWARNVNLHHVHKVPHALHDIAVPTIAAVNGHAIGGGCDVALMCDIRIASDRAVFAESFLRAGLMPGDGGAWFLPRAVGLSRALELALTSDFIDAALAERYGIVSRVVPHDLLMAEATALAARIARNPPNLVKMIKRLFRFGAHATLEDTLEMTANMQGIVQTSGEHREAVRMLIAALERKEKS
jgi:enoyl-CoA hydratase/carnithine racemase